MVLATAARSVAGKAAERLEVVPLPGPVAWESIEGWTRMFSHDGQSERIERCLFTAYHLGHEDKILPLLYKCAVEPRFLGFADNLLSLGRLAEIVESFGWEQSSELVFNLGAKLIGRRRDDPERFRRDAVGLMTSMVSITEALNASTNSVIEYDEDAFVDALLSVNIQKSFEAVAAVLEGGVGLDRLITTLVLVGVWQPFPTGGSTRPSMVLSPASRSGSFATTYIASMSPAGLLPADLSVRLTVNGTATSNASIASPGSPAQVTVDSQTYYITWFDATQDGMVTSTDTFTMSGLNGWVPATSYALQVLWKDGTVFDSTSWSS